MKSIVSKMLGVGFAMALSMVLSTRETARAADPVGDVKGAQLLQQLNSPEQAAKLKKGATIAMVCTKCKNVAVVRVEKERGREFLRPGSKHACAGCNSVIEVVPMGGHGLDKQNLRTVKHVCQSCGDESAFCCATKPGGKNK